VDMLYKESSTIRDKSTQIIQQSTTDWTSGIWAYLSL